MKSLKLLIGISVLSLFTFQALADVNPADKPRSEDKAGKAAGCEPGKTSTELYINNVRTLIHTGGDMWWDLQGAPVYEVPATESGNGPNALFCGGIWMGGLDANGQLKLAAVRYRGRGVDYWTGPLITSGSEIASVSFDVCNEYDSHYPMGKKMVDEFRAWFNCQEDPECNVAEEFPTYSIPEEILDWPAHGPAGGYAYYLAPFWDYNGDGYYNPYDGDFPYYEYPDEGITDDPNCIRPRDREAKIYGDSTLWWVYNDKGNNHTETGGDAIGMEIRAQAFGFSTNDELNDMTFYNYNLINRSTYTLYETYFGIWTDADLGNPYDDYVGCDVKRGLGYLYNGDNEDEDEGSSPGYGEQPPAIGIDFFEGPYQDPDGKDNSSSYDTVNGSPVLNCNKGDILNGNINGLNFEDGTIDNERWGMRRFLYFNNVGGGHNPNTTDPTDAIDYYNYMTGYWKDGSPLLYGGTGHESSSGATNMETDFMFPGNPTTDICGWGQGGEVMPDWSEETEDNAPYDRRFVQSAGPFTLQPGAVNDITLGAVYARASSGGPWESVNAVKRADDKAQTLFENCFRVLNGPDAPELNIVELDKKLIFHIYNKENSNNYLEEYEEEDNTIICGGELDPCDEYYRFQGYQVFQLKNESAGVTDREDRDLVREVFQCDIKDDVSQLVNYNWSDELGANVPQEMVNGANSGIEHSFVITEDRFASGDKRLINHKTYYYTAVAYGYNKTEAYDQQIQETFNGLKKPYLAGRNNIKKYTGMPHINDPANEGTEIQAEYGYGPEISQIEGYGNGNNVLDLKEETIETIMSGYPWKDHTPTYINGKGPIDVKVIDPLNVVDGSYTLKFHNASSNYYGLQADGADWILIDNANNDTIHSDYPINKTKHDQLLLDLGLSISINQVYPAAYKNRNDLRNGFLEASIEFEDETRPWLSFIPDGDNLDPYNWIRLGDYTDDTDPDVPSNPNYNDYLGHDPDQDFEKILGGTWGPTYHTSQFKYGPLYDRSQMNIDKYGLLSSVDVVFTSDTSKWTRCVVLEMCENEWTTDEDGFQEEVKPYVNHLSEGNALRFDLRQSPSVDKNGDPIPGDTTHGLSWFPGYAIDVRTGERLNMAFGEDSWLKGENGDDMMWNPSDGIYNLNGPLFGGKHYIYVFGNTNYVQNPEISTPAYDSCKWIHDMMMEYEENQSIMYKRWALSGAMWTSIPYLNEGYELLETDVKVRIRVATPYFQRFGELAIDDPENDNFGMYTFNTTDIQTLTKDLDVAESALDLIRVVPNPYYGTSYYETSQLDNRVRITNLPQKCTISIYNVSGRLIRRFTKANDASYIDWDLKNSYNIAISSGMYIIHIDAPDIGEKVVKWFGSLRPVDLQNF